jgi:hypothetical protein
MKTFHKPIPMLSLLALLLVVVWGCRKEKPAFDLSDKDPCSCAQEVSAEFVIEERVSAIPEKWIETDSILKNKLVKFSAKFDDAEEYKWYIGSETFNTKNASRFFTFDWAGYNIPITLVVKKTPNSTCFPNDDGYDSITKVFHVSQYLIEPAPTDEDRTVYHGGIGGTYRMLREGETDSIEIKISFVNIGGSLQIDFENLDGLGTICDYDPNFLNRGVTGRAYRELHFGTDQISNNFCVSLMGFIRRPLGGPDIIEVISRMQSEPQGPVIDTWYRYRGRKIN